MDTHTPEFLLDLAEAAVERAEANVARERVALLTYLTKNEADTISGEALENFTQSLLFHTRRADADRRVLAAMVRMVKAPPTMSPAEATAAENWEANHRDDDRGVSEPHMIAANGNELWGVFGDGVPRYFACPTEAREAAQSRSDQGELILISYFPAGASLDEGVNVQPEGPWLTVTDELMRPTKEG